MFALVDCNNFYASCERVFRPNLNEEPVVILSNNDGCVIARSNEAKAMGIPMGAPAFKFKQILEEKNIHVFSSNFTLYGDMSDRVMSILRGFTPDVEIYSIDEAFLYFDEKTDFQKLGEQMRKTVLRSTGIPISVGFAPTKSLAKVANRIAKKFPVKTKGSYVIDSEEKREKALKWLAIGDVWGIGRRNAKRLDRLGVKTAYQFTKLADALVRKEFSVVGLRLKKDLEGKPTLLLEDEIKDKKSIATTRTFETNYAEPALIEERISTFAVSCAEKLRKSNLQCNALVVFIHTNKHRLDLPQTRMSTYVNLPYPTNSNIELSKFATAAFKRLFKKGFHYKKAGVIAMGIAPEKSRQLSLFENSNPRHKALMKAVDELNKSLDQRQKIKLASQDLKRVWKMKQERLSPSYTTKLSDIIKVQCKK